MDLNKLRNIANNVCLLISFDSSVGYSTTFDTGFQNIMATAYYTLGRERSSDTTRFIGWYPEMKESDL